MAKYLVIVESPGKLKTIGKFLGKDYKIAASIGHIRDLPKSKLGIDLENNFEPQYIPIRGKGDVIKGLRKEAKAATKVFLATDPDREGEAISWHLAALLGIEPEKGYRVSFNEITQKAVKEAVSNPRTIDLDLVDAQQGRRILDRIVGYKISPILWKKVKKGLSAGRVQSVAVRIIVDRENEINAFEPVEYWNLTAKLKKENDAKVFEARFHGKNDKKIELKTKEQVDEIFKAVENGPFVVKSVKIGEKKRHPSAPFITSTLQQEASRKLGLTTRSTMSAAQKLYEGVEIKGHGNLGLITYMRTDSVRISSEAAEAAKQHIIANYGAEYLPSSPRLYKNRNASQDAHEAIRPTYWNMTPSVVKPFLPNDQFKVYKLIWDKFLASQMASAIYDTVSSDIDSNGYTFKASGSKVRFNGYLSVYTEGKDEGVEEEKEMVIPILEVGEQLILKELPFEQKFTTPPMRYTEATLVKMLEENGIGRPSTYSATISTIMARNYVVKDKKLLIPTELGTIVTDLLKEYFQDIVDIDFTANMESNLDKVEEGKMNWRSLMKEFYDRFSVVLAKAEDEISKIEIPQEISEEKCEKCGRNFVVKQGKFGKFLACPGFPECRNTKPIVVDSGIKCPKCGAKMLIRKDRRGRDYYSCEKGVECNTTVFDKPNGELCETCHAPMVIKTSGKNSYSQCSNRECPTKKEKSSKNNT
ncbi:MAG: type I DNA topoisomerase [Bacillota bacterium]